MALPKRLTVYPSWKGCTAIIVASGQSLTTDQVRTIAIARHRSPDHVRVMAVNDGIFPCWFADWLHAGDWQWWHWHIQAVHTFPGIKTTLAEDVPEPWVTGYLKNTGDVGFDPDPSHCRTGGSSVYQGIHILVHAGVTDIVLVGVDMQGTHYFGDHPDRVPSQYNTGMLPRWPSIVPTLEERGVSVWNASPSSALEIFPKVDLKDRLRLFM